MNNIDPCSLSNISDVLTTHFHLSLKADFNSKKLSGDVKHSMKFINEKVKNIIFDTRNLSIHNVSISSLNDSSKSVDLSFIVDESKSGPLGIPLSIDLDNAYSNQIINGSINETFIISIKYNTNPESIGIQWLDKSQTDGKEHPYLFTQFQAIHCRTAVPCQDSPSNKVTYSADIQVPKPLKALMSAILTNPSNENENENANASDDYSTFSFNQKVPIPTYLLALVIGDLQSAEIGPRSKVWCEPCTLDKASYEFANTEEYLKKVEEFISKYEWGIYDLLCLPGSFPYGGMENPCLTFVTPTLLAGDRSLTTVVCHEIAHSWTGNLVTNATWEHFWLNEGFTVFTERKIYGILDGESARHFDYILGNKSLNSAIKLFGEEHPFTALVPKLENIDPDEAFSSIPYEKGSQFLFYLESIVGKDKFENFFRKWILSNKFKSATTIQFQEYFKNEFGDDNFNKIDWDGWLYKPGYPPVDIIKMLDDSLAVEARQLASDWINADKQGNKDLYPNSDSTYNKLTTDQKIYFLDQILEQSPNGVSSSTLEQLNSLYNLSKVNNSEIRMCWLSLCLTSKDESCFSNVVQFITVQGRMKFVRPLYRLLAKCGSEGFKLANNTFTENKSFYHNIATRMIQQDLSQIKNTN